MLGPSHMHPQNTIKCDQSYSNVARMLPGATAAHMHVLFHALHASVHSNQDCCEFS